MKQSIYKMMLHLIVTNNIDSEASIVNSELKFRLNGVKYVLDSESTEQYIDGIIWTLMYYIEIGRK